MTTPTTAGGARVVAALGTAADLGALRLAGVEVRSAESPEEVRAAWPGLQGCGLVVLTPDAAAALGAARLAPGAPLTVVVPP
jgi:hypothetical protein